jgi:hypothetical protein
LIESSLPCVRRRGMERLRFTNQDFAHIKPCVVPCSCSTTAYTTADTPTLLASPKAWSVIAATSSWCGAKDRESRNFVGVLCTTLPSVTSRFRAIYHSKEYGLHTFLGRDSFLATS